MAVALRLLSPGAVLGWYGKMELPSAVQVEDALDRNAPPRLGLQLLSLSDEVHSSDKTAHVPGVEVDGSSRTDCGGVPIRKVNVDHGPSMPSLYSGTKPALRLVSNSAHYFNTPEENYSCIPYHN
jgi:hypothetical protein